MGIFSNKVNVNIINNSWEFILSNVKLKTLPRENELLLATDDTYYRVLNIIHSLNAKKDIFIVVEKFNNEKK